MRAARQRAGSRRETQRRSNRRSRCREEMRPLKEGEPVPERERDPYLEDDEWGEQKQAQMHLEVDVALIERFNPAGRGAALLKAM